MSLQSDRNRSLDVCDLLDVFEEAALHKKTLTVSLHDGRTLTDEVKDVVTEGGENYVVFRGEPRVNVKDIRDARAPRH